MDIKHYDSIIAELEAERNIVTNEDFAKVTGMVKRSFNRIVAQVRDLARTTTTWDFIRPEVINTAQVRSTLSGVSYLDLNDYLVDTPVGFASEEIHAYIQALESVYRDMVNGYRFIDKNVMIALSKYIDEPELFTEPVNTGDVEQLRQMAIQQTSAFQELEKFFTSDREWQQPFTKVYASNAECVKSMETLNNLNKERWLALNPKAVKKRVNDINKLSLRLLTDIERHKPTSENVEYLMDLVSYSANWTRMYGGLTAKVIDLTTALKSTEKKLLRR